MFSADASDEAFVLEISDALSRHGLSKRETLALHLALESPRFRDRVFSRINVMLPDTRQEWIDLFLEALPVILKILLLII